MNPADVSGQQAAPPTRSPFSQPQRHGKFLYFSFAAGRSFDVPQSLGVGVLLGYLGNEPEEVEVEA